MLNRLKKLQINFTNLRLALMYLVFIASAVILIRRVFQLQIVEGADMQREFELKIQKERPISSTRGNIYDCNGVLLAYNELSNSVTIEDVYESGSDKNARINETLRTVLSILKENGEQSAVSFNIYLDEDGKFAFSLSGTRLQRFLADVYGRTRITDLKEKEKVATAADVMEYLAGPKNFGIGVWADEEHEEFLIGEGFTREELLEITAIRYAMKLVSFQKYIPVTIATQVSERTVAKLEENSDSLPGIEIASDTIRKYKNGPYFSQIIGYTGSISTEELEALNSAEGLEGVKRSPQRITYTSSDVIGKTGIERTMEEYLQGTKGYEKLFVDRLGRELEVLERAEPRAGGNVHLTIDADLQMAVYDILEKFVAGLLVEKIINVYRYDTTDVSSKDLKIPIVDVYKALFSNNVIDLSRIERAEEGTVQAEVYRAFLEKQAEVFAALSEELLGEQTTPYRELSEEMQEYESYILSGILSADGLLSGVDTEDPVYKSWASDRSIGIREYLEYAISQNWIDITQLSLSGRYADAGEVYETLMDYAMERLLTNRTFDRKLYQYLVEQERISGRQICMLLVEQDLINPSQQRIEALQNGTVSAFSFMVELIRSLEITPAQLALDPYSASCVITDVNTGDVKALVSYPSYDNNRLANGIDSEYFAWVNSDENQTKPMWNYATQMTTAPGSTFKMVSATAALMEHVVGLSDRINCPGIFTRFTDYQPRCWHRSGHGSLTISQAITNSCNVFFYEVGYQLGMDGDTYNSDLGDEKLAHYADLYGLTEKSGVEIEESAPQLSSDLSVASAIGQGSNNFTTVGLARYVTTVANSGTCYNLTLLDRVTDYAGHLLEDYQAQVRNTVDLPEEYWDAIHTGMRGVVQAKRYYDTFPIHVAGKTGTAEENVHRPNHGLFVGYAPYEEPEISVAIRIANGYSSDYAAQISKQVLTYYYDLDEDGILTGSQTALTVEEVNGGGD